MDMAGFFGANGSFFPVATSTHVMRQIQPVSPCGAWANVRGRDARRGSGAERLHGTGTSRPALLGARTETNREYPCLHRRRYHCWWLAERTLGRDHGIVTNLVVGVLGAIPIAGDVFDVMFRANLKNMALLRGHLEKRGLRRERGPVIDADDERVG